MITPMVKQRRRVRDPCPELHLTLLRPRRKRSTKTRLRQWKRWRRHLAQQHVVVRRRMTKGSCVRLITPLITARTMPEEKPAP